MLNMHCPLCRCNEVSIRYSENKFKVLQCNNCTLGFLSPIPKKIKNLYTYEYFKNNEKYKGYFDYRLMQKEFRMEAASRLEFINKYNLRDRSILDIGAGFGDFAYLAKKSGFNVNVIDISRYAISKIKKRFKIDGYTKDLSENIDLKKQYNIITAWDAIEHISNLDIAFENIWKLLEKDGLLFLTTPNLDSLEAKILGRFWYGFKKIPEHIFYFTPKSLELSSKKYGFEVIGIKRSGFFRSLDFIARKIYFHNRIIGKVILNLVSILGINSKIIYFPFIDMLCILKKTEKA